ncbi:hypothetical protein [[Limnothrix rosea] IAM M-220]|uniref:arginine synthesis PII-interacting regulator PirA n=1 Tax=[Limnothrix rosea] IAM M-220 TaxID=454133 RepID=UPI0015C53BB8|nr:hypothetical protein [[Limnothrix rosea] IAM M-220]
MLNIKQNRNKQVKEAHRNYLQRHLKHRLEAARNQGNESLILQLQDEARYLHINI